MEALIESNQGGDSSGGYFDAFMGLANTYVSTRYSESSRERVEPIDYSTGNTDTIQQTTKGQSQAGETIVVKPDMNVKKIAVYSGIGLGFLVVAGVVYKVVK